jgi:GNAT superfamily N-acetyltransferase
LIHHAANCLPDPVRHGYEGMDPMTARPADYRVSEVLRDGTPITIRAIRPDDKERLLRHFQGLSAQSVYQRFIGFKRSLTSDDLRRLTELDFVNHVGLAATIGACADEKFLGVGRYICQDQSCAEVAFAVLDDYQGRGIGTLLLKHLALLARQHGLSRFNAYVMGNNRQMLEVFLHSGYRAEETYDSGIVRITLDLE